MASAVNWPPVEGPPPAIGALVAGWAAWAIDAILRKNDAGQPLAARYAAVMSPEQRREFETACRAIKLAAQWHEGTRPISVDGSAETPLTETDTDSGHEMDTAAAATVLGVTERRVCQLAAGWAEIGMARKVGRTWRIDRDAVRVHHETMRRTA